MTASHYKLDNTYSIKCFFTASFFVIMGVYDYTYRDGYLTSSLWLSFALLATYYFSLKFSALRKFYIINLLSYLYAYVLTLVVVMGMSGTLRINESYLTIAFLIITVISYEFYRKKSGFFQQVKTYNKIPNFLKGFINLSILEICTIIYFVHPHSRGGSIVPDPMTIFYVGTAVFSIIATYRIKNGSEKESNKIK